MIGQGILRSSLTDQPVVSTIQPSHDGAKGIAEARRVLLEIRTSVHGVEGVGVKDIGEFQHDQLIAFIDTRTSRGYSSGQPSGISPASRAA